MAEERRPIVVTDFRKGVQLKADALDDPGFMRMTGFKFGARIGSLESRGGFDDWDLGTDFTYIQGFKRWYRADGFVGTYLVGVTTGGTHGIYQVNLHNKTLSSLYTITDIVDVDAPAQWVDCGDQLILILGGSNSRPYSIKRIESETIAGDGGSIVRKLGLDAPTGTFSASVNIIAATITNHIDDGVYQYTYTYLYGTPSNPTLYGESGPGPISAVTVFAGSATNDLVINQLTGLPTFTKNGIIRKIRIYRTLADGSTFYRIGEIEEFGQTAFNDAIPDSEVDVSQILPTYTGIPGPMTCAEWHAGIQRLLYFDARTNRFGWSAAGRPDVTPSNQYQTAGDLGFPGRGIKTILDNIYAFKEDGIFRIFGDAPNYVPRRVSDVQYVSSASFGQMPDGIYALGMESGEIRVYRFDGNAAVPISTPIDAIPSYRTSTTAKHAVGRRVGSEYWLSISTQDTRYAAWPVPHNNVILPYDYRYGAWTGPFPVQAGAIEVFDGPGDKGETFVIESDPTSSAAKGNLFRLENTLGTSNQTTYSAGVRNYQKSQLLPCRLSVGVFTGITQSGMQKLDGFQVKMRVRGILGQSISCGVYDDSLTLATLVGSGSVLEETLDVSSQLTAAQKVGTTYGTGIYVDNYAEDYQWNLSLNVPKTGLVVDVSHVYTTRRLLQIEAIELRASATEQE